MKTRRRWKAIVLAELIVLTVVTTLAVGTGLWVLTAIPIGFLFGFFLERSDLCGASAFSEVVMMRDHRKVAGLWVAIVVGMLVFSLGAAWGWFRLSPKPLIWASYLVGGATFGVGTVLAGGCVSGALFKAGQGNLNSMAALVAIPLGVSAVAYGPLQGLNQRLRRYVIKADDGGSVSLPSATGLPYWAWAVLFCVATGVGAYLLLRRSKREEGAANPRLSSSGLVDRVLTRAWKPWQSGVAIGLLGLVAYCSSAASGRSYPLGVTHGVLDVQVLTTDYPVDSVWKPKAQPASKAQASAKAASAAPPTKPAVASPHKQKHVVWWLVALVASLVVGSFTSSKLRGSFNLRPKPPDETVTAFFGGLLVGAGAALAGGCIIGNVVSGVALMSLGNVLFLVVVVLANWATTYFYLMGGSLGRAHRTT